MCITERIHITSNTRSATLTPKSKDELRSIIVEETKRQGPDANLNFIDTSLITDMSYLFSVGGFSIGSIKIDEWDVSNVKNMSYMFMGCSKLKCDLSGWDVSKVGPLHTHIFRLATKMKPHLRPKPSW